MKIVDKFKNDKIFFISFIFLTQNFILSILTNFSNLFYIIEDDFTSMSQVLPILLGYLLRNIPSILFFVYMVFFYQTDKKQGMISVSCFLTLVLYLITVLSQYIMMLNYGTSFNISVSIVINVAFFAFIFVTTVKEIKPNIIKIVLFIKLCTVVIDNIIYVIEIIQNGMEVDLSVTIPTICSSILYNIGLFLILPKISSFIHQKKREKLITTNTENLLLELKQAYESGIIGEQEYNEKKAEILNCL